MERDKRSGLTPDELGNVSGFDLGHDVVRLEILEIVADPVHILATGMSSHGAVSPRLAQSLTCLLQRSRLF